MTLLFKLIWRDLRANPGRVAVSVFAILVSVSLIVWMMGSYDTLVKEFDNDAEAYMGSYDLCLVPEAPKGPLPPGQYPRFSDPDLAARLAASPLVESVNAACQVPRLQIGCGNERGSFDEQTRDRMGIPPQSPILVGNHAVECPYDLKEGVWPDMASSSAMEGVLGSGSAKYFSAGVGTVMNVRVGTHVYDVKVVGIVKQAKATPGVIMGPGGMSGPAFSSLFVPVKVCEKITGQPFAPNLIYVQLKEGVDKKEFVDGLRQELAQASAVVADTDSIIQRLSSDRSVRSQKESAEMSVWLVLFSCVFIIFTTLSIGVSERTRRLALMRALGMSRMQIALLIVGEGLFLCIPALLGGMAAGFCLVYLLEEGSSSVPVLTWTTVLAAAACAVGGALLASIIPAWRASRQSPLEAAVPSSGFIGKVSRVPVWSVIAGLACVCLQPAALLLPGLEVETRKWIFFWLGYPGLVAGALFLAPAFVRVTEWAGSWITGLLLRVPHSFLKVQLSRNLSRSVGTAVSMSVGLSLFVGVQTWGYSMLVPFSPDTSTPGTLVSFLHTEFKPADVPELMARPSLRNSRMYPIYVDEPDIAPAQMKTPGFSGMRNRSIVLAGIPVAEMAQGSHPLFRPVFVSGNPQEAYAMLESTRSLLIPDTFARTVGLKAGDDLMLVNPSHQGRRSGNAPSAGAHGRGRGPGMQGEPWKVAGVVSFPGWHWLTKTSGMRVRRGGFVAALAIADERWLKEEYGHQGFQFIWGDTAPGVSNLELQNDLGEYALMKVRQQENEGEGVKPLVKALTRESLGGSVTSRGDDVIFTMSKLPIIMMVIAVLAVLNTVLASVQSRRREFGLMRAVGVPAAMVMRMLWAETLMVSLCAVVMSLALGVLGAWCSIQILEYGYHFGIVTPPITMPWAHLGYAVLLVLALSSLACLLPAWRMKRASVTDLLSVREG
ncbi:ABC transporter permease [Akkermansia sp.]|uniref:ABC transporter permease n=1 Tax=Akkermansia sp. TaxID=1872421 RepID=UPI003A8F164A